MVLLTKPDIEKIIKRSPFNQFLNLEVVELEENRITLKLPFQNVFLRGSKDSGGSIHGGIIASLIDVTGDFVFALVYDQPLPTINLQIDYLRMAPPEDLYAEAKIIKNGKSICVSDIVVRSANVKQIAIGRGIYSSVHLNRK